MSQPRTVISYMPKRNALWIVAEVKCMRMLVFVVSFSVALLLFSSEVSAQRKSVSRAEATGTFSAGEYDNSVKILPLGKGKLKVAFSLIYVRILFNGESIDYTGTPSGIAKIEGDVAVLDLSENDRVCKITIKFVKPGTLEVSEAGDCMGLVGGMNVSSFGTYIRTSKVPPRFSF